MTTTIGIPRHDVLRGDFSITGDTTINGPGRFDPNSFEDTGNVTINAVTLGGTINAGRGNMTFTNRVDHGTTVNLTPQATITIEHPQEFQGTIGFVNNVGINGPSAEFVDLVGLANAAEYSLKNDLLTIRSADGKAIDQLHLTDSVASRIQPVSPQEVIADAGNVYLVFGYGFDIIPGGNAAGTVLHPVASHH